MTEPQQDSPTTTASAQTPQDITSWDDLGMTPTEAAKAIAESRKWEKRAKENHGRVQELEPRVRELEPLAEQFRQLEQASKSEDQRRDEALEEARRSAEDARRTAEQNAAEALRLRVALKHGISADDFDLLGSGTPEQVEANAQRLAEKNKAVQDAMSALDTAPPGAPPSRRPSEQLKPGATPPSVPQLADQDYPAEWLSPTQRARVQQAREQYQ